MIEMFKEFFDVRHEYAREWKRKTGGKVLGCFCTYIPEEILYAADVLPVRMPGGHELRNVTESYVHATCRSCGSADGAASPGVGAYLDGIALSQSCRHLRESPTSWDQNLPVEFSHYLPTPHQVQSPRAVAFTRAEFEVFKARVEEWTDRRLSDDDLLRGIEIVNHSRRLMKKAYELRKRERVPLSGLEAMHMVVSSQVTDKREFSPILEGALDEMEGRELETGTRLFLLGSETDDTELVELIESCDATVVQDDHCTGTRYFWDEVGVAGDPLTAIADRYVNRMPCPTKNWPEQRRIERILRFANDWDVAGVVAIQKTFCDSGGLDVPAIRSSLEEAGLDVLFVAPDESASVEHLRIRIEVFLESLTADDLF